MLAYLEHIIHFIDNILMNGFFWYTIGFLIVSVIETNIKPTLFKIDTAICKTIAIAGWIYILAVLLMYILFHEILFSLITNANGKLSGAQLTLWCMVLVYPLLLFIFSQLLRIEKMRNSILFRGITAILFLIIY